jgi:hypothetical protein
MSKQKVAKSKFGVSRKQNARIIFHEILFALAIALFFVVLVMLAMGYRLRRDSKSGLPVLERTSLLRVSSYPTGANIILNDADTGRKTTLSAQRLVISAGNHTLRVVRDGYHSWQHAFTTAEAEITWFDYIQLFPTGRSGDVVKSFDSTHQVWRSPIGERALVLTPATKASSPKLNIVALSATGVTSTSVDLSADLAAPDLVVWSKDDGLALMCERKPVVAATTAKNNKSTASDSAATDKCVLLDVDRARITELNLPIEKTENLLDAAFVNSRAILVATNSKVFLYDTTAKTTQKLDVKVPSANRPEHLAITTNDATLLYYSKSNDNKTTYHLATVNASGALDDIYTDDAPFEFASSRYLDNVVVAIANRSRLKVYFSNSNALFGTIGELNLQNEYGLPVETTPIVLDGRFLVAASGLAVNVERWVASTFDNACHDTTWQRVSNAQLYCPDNNRLLIKDFDGENQIAINLPDGVTMPAPTTDLTGGDLPTTMKPAALVNRRTLYYWTVEHVNDALQLQLRQLKL